MKVETAQSPASIIPKVYYSPNELAERWGVSPATVRLWISSGTLEAYRVGPRLLKVPAYSVTAYERLTGLRASCP